MKEKEMRMNLRSRRGVTEPTGFIIALPVWYIAICLLLVLGYWMWSLAVNVVGLSQAGQALGVGRDAEAIRRGVLAAGLGGFAADYRDAASYHYLPRTVIGEVDHTTEVRALPAPRSLTVRARTVARLERFYARPPEAGGWE
jgi:hypothetical protein